ncbi:MAG: hypothetical protein WCV55_03175 [Candidatus Paceibacterota bacterium]
MYNVVFECKAKTGGFVGSRFWSTFKSEEAFKKSWAKETKSTREIIAEGISEKRCAEIVNEAPLTCQITAIFEKSRDKKGVMNEGILRMEFLRLIFSKLFK